MSRRRPQASKRTSSPKKVQPATPAGGRPRLPHREMVGGALLLVAVLTLLGLLGASGGSVLSAWAGFVRRLFGWGIIPLTLLAGFAGLWLLWRVSKV